MIKSRYYKIIYLCIFTFVFISFSKSTINASNKSLKDSDKLPMLWDFGAKKCIPCKKMAPILDQLAEKYKGRFTVKFTDVWMSENVQEAKKYVINSIPTQIFFNKNGKELWRHVGFISEESILLKWKSLGYDFSNSKTKDKNIN
jgi:thioredoxin 1